MGPRDDEVAGKEDGALREEEDRVAVGVPGPERDDLGVPGPGEVELPLEPNRRKREPDLRSLIEQRPIDPQDRVILGAPELGAGGGALLLELTDLRLSFSRVSSPSSSARFSRRISTVRRVA